MAARGGAASAAIDAGLALMLVALPVSVSGAQAGLALASVGATVESARRRSLPRTPLDAPLLTLLGVTVLSAALSADPALSLRKVASAWVALALYVVVARFPDPAALARMLRLAVPTAVLAGAFGVVQHFTGWRLPGKPGGTLHSFVSGGRTLWFPEGGFSHYQTFANVFLMLFCVFLGLALGAGDRRARAVASVGGAVAALAVLFSYTHRREEARALAQAASAKRPSAR